MILEEVGRIAVGIGDRVPNASRLIGLYWGASDLIVEASANKEGLVAENFAIEPKTGTPGEVAIIRIDCQLLGGNSRICR